MKTIISLLLALVTTTTYAGELELGCTLLKEDNKVREMIPFTEYDVESETATELNFKKISGSYSVKVHYLKDTKTIAISMLDGRTSVHTSAITNVLEFGQGKRSVKIICSNNEE